MKVKQKTATKKIRNTKDLLTAKQNFAMSNQACEVVFLEQLGNRLVPFEPPPAQTPLPMAQWEGVLIIARPRLCRMDGRGRVVITKSPLHTYMYARRSHIRTHIAIKLLWKMA